MKTIGAVMSECKEWNRGMFSNGYGRIWNKGAHRYAYETQVGAIPEGLELDHLCRNKTCVNVEHLEPVTKQENLRRRSQAIWDARGGKCIHGHAPENIAINQRGKFCRECKRISWSKSTEKYRQKIRSEANDYPSTILSS